MTFWEFIWDKLNQEVPVELLYVLESEGSSPGRRGFKMAAAADGDMYGTIGGGIMEHKLVEKARSLLAQAEQQVLLMRQYHDKVHARDQSGMICSGSQLNAFIPLLPPDKITIGKIIAAQDKYIRLSPAGLEFAGTAVPAFQFNAEDDWVFTDAINLQSIIHIIGAGHVGLALSELMRFLGFHIKLYDDRDGLNTMEANSFAHEKLLVDYEKAAEQIITGAEDFVVIATMGYRTDKTVLKQILDKSYAYLGVLGSDHKIKVLKKELLDEGMPPGKLEKIHMPVGINILSKTTKEIAVSIAAEIIRVKNKDLPTGRSTDL